MWEQIALQVLGAILSNPTVQKGIGEVIADLKSKNDVVLNALITAIETGLESVQKNTQTTPQPAA